MAKVPIELKWPPGDMILEHVPWVNILGPFAVIQFGAQSTPASTYENYSDQLIREGPSNRSITFHVHNH